MAVTSIENRFIWLNGEILNVNDAKINVLAPTSQFGLNVFEGICCYWNEDENQLYAFRLEDHYERLRRSCRLLQMDDLFSSEDMKQALIDVVKANQYKENITVRQTLFVEGFGTWSSSGPVGMFVAPIPRGAISSEYTKKGLHCCVSSYRRIDDNTLSPRIKCGANYMNSRVAQLEAKKNGYDTAVLLNQNGKLAEGPGSCLFIVRDGKLYTPMVSDSILESITRDTILKLAPQLGLEAVERTIDRTELYQCDEAFLCGSAMEITPILSADRFVIGDGKCGELTARLYKAYMQTVRGNNAEFFNWITPVYR